MIEHNEQKACCTPSAPSREILAVPKLATSCCASTTNANTSGMKKLAGGAFLMGTDSDMAWASDGEGPVREVLLAPFLIDICAVTNAQWEQFATASGYSTEAERYGWSYVFTKHVSANARRATQGVAAGTEWWLGIEGACWKRPEGQGSNLRKRMDHPVVHISWHDAQKFCEWAGKRLPTEAEWEYAARGGLEQNIYPWGNDLTPKDKRAKAQHMCNIWQGKFPDFNSGADGHIGTAPVKSFAPNGYGLYNMSGNVWEWCEDWFSPAFHIHGPRQNPTGPKDGAAKVIKGGSFMCHASYCNRYRVAARTANTPDSSTAHCGFRCVLNAE